MSGESEFVRDLAVLMSAAGLVAVVFSRLGWPKVIGYILAGVVLGSHTFGGSMLARPSSIGTIGQLGVVFLMFAMGCRSPPATCAAFASWRCRRRCWTRR